MSPRRATGTPPPPPSTNLSPPLSSEEVDAALSCFLATAAAYTASAALCAETLFDTAI
eukprot:CAMPEP_0171921450 /NCGR_PEP_ID=MMETSP0993-20121228/20263_1 /TAXON_ID=483369 /ORGANISM="non described non described, Strain CCMP2098" /LENGTH=57 /DNA_ID=CAMNT_0012558829 /DNA_START=61 /DNA_END=235 /DNA_ORIENTATION=+